MNQYDLIDPKKRKTSKRTSLIPTAILTTIGLIVIGTIYLGGKRSEPVKFVPVPTHRTTLTVVYEVDTPGFTGSFSRLTYTNESGNTEQRTVELPWRMQFEAQPGQFVQVSAQAETLAGNECVIRVDGVVIEQADSSGEYSIASCSGTAK